MKINFFPLVVLTILSLLSACKKDNADDDFSALKQEQLVNTFDNGILPLFTEFETVSNELITEVESFNDNIDVASLNQLQQKWKEVSLLWERTEVYKLGDYNNSFLYYRIHRWPIDSSRIEELIATETQIDQTLIESLGSSLIGLSSMEYLLYANDENTTINQFQDTIRQAFLAAVAENININATASKEIWVNAETSFKNSLESAISGSQNQLANALISQVDEVIKSRLESAIGDDAVPASAELLEAFRSEISLDLIQAVFGEIEKCYTGNYDSNNGVGFDDCIKLMDNEELNTNITAAIAEVNSILTEMSGNTLSYYIENDLETVEDLRLALRELLIYLKSDMTSILSITVTISDNDGD